MEGTTKSIVLKKTNGLVATLGLELFYILINDLDKNSDKNLLKYVGDLKMGRIANAEYKIFHSISLSKYIFISILCALPLSKPPVK